MIENSKVGDVVSLAQGQFHKHLEKDKQYAITAIDSTWGKAHTKVSLTTVDTVKTKDGRLKHIGSWSGIWCVILQRNDFLTAAYNAKKLSAA